MSEVITRKAYMAAGDEMFVVGQPRQSKEFYAAKEAAHQNYFGQFVTERTISHVLTWFLAEDLDKAYEKDRYFNTLPLERWDRLSWVPKTPGRGSYGPAASGPFYSSIPFDEERFRAASPDYGATRSDLVCIAKAAARIIVERRAA